MKIQNKQDVISWLRRLKHDHPLSISICSTVDVKPAKSVKVYTDQVIKERYTDMIHYLESEEVV